MPDDPSSENRADVARSAPDSFAGRRLAVKLAPAGLKAVRQGHPWVFDAAIRHVSHEGAPGDLAVVFDDRRRFAGIGLWDPASPIRIKLLHHGDPVVIDAAWCRRMIAAAVARRAPLAASPGLDGYRLVHGENDGLPGVVLDRFGDVAVMKLYSAAWLPHLDDLVAAIAAVVDPACLVLRVSRLTERAGGRELDGSVLLGDLPEGPVVFHEHGLVATADVVRGQKTGYFLDQRDNRRKVRDLANGRRVLDVFAAAGGFAVNAAAGGASSVHAVDLSPHAIESCERHLAMNGLASVPFTGIVGDAFEAMESLVSRGRRYGLVVVDPPSFAQRQTDVRTAMQAYRRLTDLALRLLDRDGVLVQASCSSRVAAEDFFAQIHEVVARRGVPMRELATTHHAADHPIGFAEGAYLKAWFGRRV